MTEREEDLPIYPQYCFHLSETINKFCPLRSIDIESLTRHPGFEGQDVFFHLNHPVIWVRITGVVVALDEFTHRRIYTVDDSSGVCIECVVDIPKSDPQLDPGSDKRPASGKPRVPDEVDVGTVVDVKGGLALFRGNKQIKTEKVTVIRSTEQELAYWEKIQAFRREVMDRPWRLTDKEVRRCRKEAERNG
ncbi:Protein stn1 [Cytospora mali]|uniref:Protein stn1 n=1 Tax=Cytospora mali TaxID=578113 RepID=A0A194VZ68_CYTMA|nr:Protein stn1 [Valsa mali]